MPAPSTRGSFLIRHTRTLLCMLFVFLYSVSLSYAVPPTTKYAPGTTLDPLCTPGSTNCSVRILPEQSGNTNTYLTTDGSDTAWSTSTLILGGNFQTSGAYATTLTTTGTTALTLPTTGTLATTANINSAVSGTLNYVPKFTGANSVGNSQIFDNGTNVGVGTTAPNDKLTIQSGGNSGLTLRQNTSTDRFKLFVGDGTGGTNADENYIRYVNTDLHIQGGGIGTTEFVTFKGSGRVGIGTTTPNSIFVVSNAGAAGFEVNAVLRDGTSSGSSILSYDRSSSQYKPLQLSGSTAIFMINDSEKMRLDSSGNVGIGTISPSARLDIQRSASGDNLRLIGAGATDYSDMVFYATNNTTRLGYIDWSNTQARLNVEAAIPFVLSTNATVRFTIDSSGNLIASDLAGSGNRCLYADSTGQINVKGFDCGSASGGDNLGDHVATQNITLGSNWLSGDGGSEGIRIDASGNVGIGIAVPAATLDVQAATSSIRVLSTTGTNYAYQTFFNTSGAVYLGAENSTGGGIFTGSAAYSGVIGSMGARSFHIATNGIVRQTIDSSGNVGIGTASPQSKLHIDVNSASTSAAIGNVLLVANTDTTTNNMGGIWFTQTADVGNGSGIIGVHTDRTGGSRDSDLAFYTTTNNTVGEKMRILNSGNVGIGTTAPTQKLEVIGNVSAGYATGVGMVIGLVDTIPANDLNAYLLWGSAATFGGSNGDMLYIPRSSTDTSHRFYTGNGTATEKVRITTAGNVGIGTTGPLAKLDIAGDTTTYGTMAKIYLTDINANTASRNWSIGNGGSGFGNLTFAVSAAADGVAGDGTATNVMVMQSNGNVGIGTTGPGSLLDVSSSTGFASITPTAIRISSVADGQAWDTANTWGNLDFYNTDTGGLGAAVKARIGARFIDSSGSATALEFSTTNGSTLSSKMTINNAGNVGIGTTSPGYKLSINNGGAAGSGVNTALRISGGDMVNQNDATQLLFIQRDGSDDYAGAVRLLNTGGTPGYLNPRMDFLVSQTNTAAIGSMGTMMTILGSGYVGIGTTTPGQRLEVRGNATDGWIKLSTTNGNPHIASTNDLGFNTGSTNDVLYLTGLGLVGVGTSAPAHLLDVKQPTLAVGGVFHAWAPGVAGFTVNVISTSGQPYMGYTFQNGTVTIGNLPSCGGIQTNGSGTLACTSDETLKDVRGEFTQGLDAIRDIDPIAFAWKSNSGLYDDGITYYGFSAQNVQHSLPEAISLSVTGKLQVSQLTLMATAINAIKELDIKVQAIPEFEDDGSMAAVVAEFLAGIAEGIANVGRVNTDTLCVGQTCVTESELQQLLQNANVNSGPTPAPEPEPTPEPDPEPSPAPSVEPEPTPEPAQESTPEPAP